MAYISLYRKYRSQTFDDVVGQEHVTRTLQNAIKSGRVGHAYLFCGSRGTGKTTVARLLAKALNCEHGPTSTPCGACEACTSIADGSAVDFIELDAASHRGVNDIKEIRDNVKYPPMRLRYKIFVIDEAHQLSADAKDAFLKTLEEPPPHAIFVLATTEAHEIPLTIRSRCQQFDFRRGSVADIVQRLTYVLEHEGRAFEESAVQILARSAQGSYRDSLSLLEQVLAYTDDDLTAEHVNTVLGMVDEDVLFEVSDVVAREDAGAAFELAGRLIHQGKDIRELLKAIAGHFRDLLAASVGAGPDGSLKAAERARQFTKERLVSLVEVFSAAEKDLRWSEQHRLGLEMALLKAITAPAAVQTVQAAPAAIPSYYEAAPAPPPAPRPAAAAPPPARSAPTRTAPAAQPKTVAPPPAAEPSMPLVQGDVAIDQVRRAWPRVLAHIRDVQNKKLFLGVLRDAQLVRIEGNALVIGFEQRFVFHVQKFQKPDEVEVIRTALEAVIGQKLLVKAIALGGEELAQPDEPIAAPIEEMPPPTPDGTLIDDVLNTFPQAWVMKDDAGEPKTPEDVDGAGYDPWKEA